MSQDAAILSRPRHQLAYGGIGSGATCASGRARSTPGSSGSSVAARGRTAPAGEIEAQPGAARTWIAARDLNRVRRAIESLGERSRRLGTGPILMRELER